MYDVTCVSDPINVTQRKASYIKKSTEVIATKYNGDIPETVDGLVSVLLSLSLSLSHTHTHTHTQSESIKSSYFYTTHMLYTLDLSSWYWSQNGSPYHGLCLG